MVLYHSDSERYEARARPRARAEDVGPNKSPSDWSFAVSQLRIGENQPRLIEFGTEYGSIAVAWSMSLRMTPE
jgi:hypothetical protein